MSFCAIFGSITGFFILLVGMFATSLTFPVVLLISMGGFIGPIIAGAEKINNVSHK